MAAAKGKSTAAHKAWTVLGVILCAVIIPILALNLTLLVKSFSSDGKPATVGGVFPLVVLTDSMNPVFGSGDLVVYRATEPAAVSKGDIIAFEDPASGGANSSVVTHRVVKVKVAADGSVSWVTKGDANNVRDAQPVPAQNLVGAYWFSVPGAGNAALFLQTPQGIILCVVVPILALVIYDVIRRRIASHSQQAAEAQLRAELEALRAENARLGERGERDSVDG